MTFTWFQLYCAQARRLKWLQFWNKPPRISMFEIKSSTAQSLIKDMLFLLSYLREVLQLKTWVVSTPGKSNVGCLRCLLVLNFRFASKSLVSKTKCTAAGETEQSNCQFPSILSASMRCFVLAGEQKRWPCLPTSTCARGLPPDKHRSAANSVSQGKKWCCVAKKKNSLRFRDHSLMSALVWSRVALINKSWRILSEAKNALAIRVDPCHARYSTSSSKTPKWN